MKSEVEVDLRKRNRFSTKYLTGLKKAWVGKNCGVVPQNLKILWNSWPLFRGISQYFLVRRIFCGVGFVNSAFANTLLRNKKLQHFSEIRKWTNVWDDLRLSVRPFAQCHSRNKWSNQSSPPPSYSVEWVENLPIHMCAITLSSFFVTVCPHWVSRGLQKIGSWWERTKKQSLWRKFRIC